MARLHDFLAVSGGSRWAVEDWIAHGLIARGNSPGRGRGLGRAERVWPAEQLNLYRDLHGMRTTRRRDLADYVLGRWILGDPAIPQRQALRALRSWVWPERL